MPGKLENLIREINESEENGVSCIIAAGSFGCPLKVAEKLGIRSVAFWPAAAATLALPRASLNLLRRELWTQLLSLSSESELIPTVKKRRVEDYKFLKITQLESASGGNDDCSSVDSESPLSIAVSSVPEESRSEGTMSIDIISENEGSWISGDAIVRESKDDDSFSLEGDQILDSSCSISVVSNSSSVCTDDFIGVEVASDIEGQNLEVAEKINSHVDLEPKNDLLLESDVEHTVIRPVSVSLTLEEPISDGLPLDKALSAAVSRSVFEVDYVPLWGYTSLCGRRPEMEDAFATVPRFLRIPLQMLIGDRVFDGLTRGLSHLTTHFFGVYDGHGGSQVENYCRDRIHAVMAEELETIMKDISDETSRQSCQEHWKKAFTVILRLMLRLEARLVTSLLPQKL